MAEAGWRTLLVCGVGLVALFVASAAHRRRARRAERSRIDPGGLTGRVLLFTAASCPSCTRVRSRLGSAAVSFDEVRFEDRPDVHRSAGIRAVPIIAVRDRSGAVVEQLAGVPSRRRLRRALRRAGLWSPE